MDKLALALAEKEARYRLICDLIQKYRKPVVTLSLNLPGVWADYPLAQALWHDAAQTVEKAISEALFRSILAQERQNPVGCTLLMVVEGDASELKSAGMAIEAQHPLGRLLDVDVYGLTGTPLSRRDGSAAERACFICSRPASVCRWERRHSREELTQHINQRLELHYRQNT